MYFGNSGRGINRIQKKDEDGNTVGYYFGQTSLTSQRRRSMIEPGVNFSLMKTRHIFSRWRIHLARRCVSPEIQPTSTRPAYRIDEPLVHECDVLEFRRRCSFYHNAASNFGVNYLHTSGIE